MKKISDLMNLSGRYAIVTGGAGHIGLAICETLMELGATVSILDLDGNACEERCRLLNSKNYVGAAIPVRVDLAQDTETREALHYAIRKMGSLNILIHAAAFVGTTNFPGWAVTFEHQTVAAWDAAMKVNVTSAFILIQEALPHLKQSGNGSVIFIGSIYGLMGPDYRLYEKTNMNMPAGYAASKGGLAQLGRYFATTLAPSIRVNTIVSGGILRGQPGSFQNRYRERTPLARMGTEEDIKGAIAYLASDLSAYVTGSEMVIDGGWTAW